MFWTLLILFVFLSFVIGRRSWAKATFVSFVLGRRLGLRSRLGEVGSPVAYAPKLRRRSAKATFGRHSPATATCSLLVSLVIPSATALAQFQPPEVEWEKTFGGTERDEGSSVQQASDSGYIVAGSTNSFGPSADGNVYLIKTDAKGNASPGWPKIFGSRDDEWATSVQQTSDGGYIVAGSIMKMIAGEGRADVYLMKTDANGNASPGWPKTFGSTYSDRASSVQQTSDGGFIVAGDYGYDPFGRRTSDVYLIKTNANGDVAPGWPKTFGGGGDEGASSVQQTSDGGYIVAGNTSSSGGNVYLIKTDANGNASPGWPKIFGRSDWDEGSSVQQTTDGGYIVAGSTYSFGAGGVNIYLIKTDAQGDLVWQKTHGGANADRGYSVQQTTDGGYIVAGETESFGAGGVDVYLIKTDAQGDLVWQKTLGGTGHDQARSIRQTNNGGYIVAGTTYSFSAGNGDVYLVKLGPEKPPFPDCNTNGVDDALDISNSTSQDCNANQIPDECDIASGTSQDANVNGIPDECDPSCAEVASYPLGRWEGTCTVTGDHTCATYRIYDTPTSGRWTSSNGPGTFTHDKPFRPGQKVTITLSAPITYISTVTSTVSADGCCVDETWLDNNGVTGTDHFCWENSPTDCNTNGIDDAQDIASGTSQDCNANTIPDECDIASGTSRDANVNGIPDECDPPPATTQLYSFNHDVTTPQWQQLQPLFESFNPEYPTAVICHGWNCSCLNELNSVTWPLDMAAAISGKLASKVNILAWEWLDLARSPDVRDAATCEMCSFWGTLVHHVPGEQVQNQSRLLYRALQYLFQQRGYNPSQPVHLIGHSLGGHLAAWTGVYLLESGSPYVPRQVTCLDPPEADYVDVVQLNLPNICVPLSYLRDNSDAVFTELYHGQASLLAHNAELWVNVPGYTHNVYDWFTGTVAAANDPALYQYLTYPAGRLTGTVGFGTSAILPSGGNRPVTCTSGTNETQAFGKIVWPPFANGFNQWPSCRTYACTCASASCQLALNPELVDLSACVCSGDGACEPTVERVVIHLPGKGVVKVTFNIHLKINWYYYAFVCDFQQFPRNTIVDCVFKTKDPISGEERASVVWSGSSDGQGSGPVPIGPIDVRQYQNQEVEVEYRVHSIGEDGATGETRVVIEQPTFSQDPAFGTPVPEVSPTLPDIPDVVSVEPGTDTGTVTLQCPPCQQPGEHIVEYVWIVDGNFVSSEVVINIELEIGIHVISLCLADRYGQHTCRDKLVTIARSEPKFIRGDANGDGGVDVSDAIATFTRLFLDAGLPLCMDAADANDDNAVDISDAISLLGFLFLGGPAPAAPFPGVGLDPTPDVLGCDLAQH